MRLRDAAHIAGPPPEWLRFRDAALGNADAALRAAGTVLVLLVLWGLGEGQSVRTRAALAWTVSVALGLSVALSFARALAGGGGSVAGAWVRWTLEVTRPAALGGSLLTALAAWRRRRRTAA